MVLMYDSRKTHLIVKKEVPLKRKLILSLLFLSLSLSACAKEEEHSSSASVQAQDQDEEITYEDILNTYKRKMAEATPILIEEYNVESQKFKDDPLALSSLSDEKVGTLNSISEEGIQKMASLMNQNEDDYEVYVEWSSKLTESYREYAADVTKANLNSVP